MKFIILTSTEGTSIHINIAYIGHIFEVKAHYIGAHLNKNAYTAVGVTTHNNGGFQVIESVKDILNKINNTNQQ